LHITFHCATNLQRHKTYSPEEQQNLLLAIALGKEFRKKKSLRIELMPLILFLLLFFLMWNNLGILFAVSYLYVH